MGNFTLNGPRAVGTNGQYVPFIHIRPNAPTQYDTQNYYLLDQWLDTTTEIVYILVSLAGNSSSKGQLADWVPFTGSSGAVLSVNAGNNISITGTATNPVVNVAGTTLHAVQVGAANGALNSIAVGTTNTVLLGNTGADPSFGTVPNGALTNSSVTIASGTGITVTGGSPLSLGGTATVALTTPVSVANGGTGDSSFTPYSVICGGTTSTSILQNVSGVGSSGAFLTSQGAGALPVWTALGANPGTWTPSLSFSGSTSGVVYITQVGIYYQIGKLVFIEYGIVVSSIGTSSGNMTVTGLPFTAAALPVAGVVNGSFVNTDGITLTANYTNLYASIIPLSSSIQFNQTGSGQRLIQATDAIWTISGGFAAISNNFWLQVQ